MFRIKIGLILAIGALVLSGSATADIAEGDRFFFELGQYEKAIESYTEALSREESAEAYNKRGMAYYNLKRYEKAIEDYNRAIELDPKDPTNYCARGYVYCVMKRYERAIEDFNRAIELEPKGASVYQDRGWVYGFMKQYEKAIEDFDRALEIEESAWAYAGKAVILYQMGKLEEAKRVYRISIQLDDRWARELLKELKKEGYEMNPEEYTVYTVVKELYRMVETEEEAKIPPIPEEYFPESSLTENSESLDGEIAITENTDQTPEIFVQMGHISGSFNETNAVAFTSNGDYILSGNGDGTIKLWETGTGRELRTFRCFEDVEYLDVSSDGKYMVTGEGHYLDNINLWNIATGKKIGSFSHDSTMNGSPVAFCNNGKNILSGGREETLKLWDIESGRLIREFKADSKDPLRKPEVRSIVLTRDGKSAIVGCRYSGREEVNGVLQDVKSWDNTIRVWDLATGKETLSFNKGNGWVKALGITPDGKHVISGDYDDIVRIWDAETGIQISTFQSRTSSIDISAAGRYALFGGCMSFELVELSSGKVIRIINKGIDGWVRSIAFSPDGKYALVGDDSSKPKLYDLSANVIVKEFGGYSDQTNTVKLSETGNVMLTANRYNNIINIWDYHSGRLIKAIPGDSSSIMSSATISSDGKLLATGGWNHQSRTSNAIIWDVALSKQITHIKLEEESGAHTKWLDITADNKYLIWATREHLIISDLQSGKEIKKISDPYIRQIKVDPKGKYVIAQFDSGTKVISVPEGEFIKRLSEEMAIGTIIGKKYIYDFTEKYYEKKGYVCSLTIFDLIDFKEKSKTRIERLPTVIAHGTVYDSDLLCLAFHHDGGMFKYDLSRNTITEAFPGHADRITGLETTPDGKFVCTSSVDGTTRFWNIETGKEAAQFISFTNGEWIVITPEGYFNASPEGAKYLNVRLGNKVYAIDQFFEKFYNPAVVAQVLSGRKIALADDIKKGFKTSPDVVITSPRPNEVFDREEIEVIVQAKDTGGGIDEIRLYHNGSAVGEARRGIKIVKATPSLTRKAYRVILVDGENIFRAVGFSEDRTQSSPYELIVKLTAPKKSVSLHLFVVGINRYENSDLNLNFAEPDAKAIKEFFARKGKTLFKDVKTTEFYNEDATKENILSKLDALKTDPQDVVIIYLAGHGISLKDNWYFIPHDVLRPERPPEVMAKGISSLELIDKISNIQALKKLVLIDACKSGTILLAFARGLEERRALAQLARATGVHLITASTKDQYASEVKDLGHGVFTYTLLEGLKGKAHLIGNKVTVRGLLTYVEDKLPEISRKYRQEAQYPVSDSRGMDFPLVLVK